MAMAKAKTARDRDIVLSALQRLPPLDFEKLVAQLLSRLLGIPIRRARSGAQYGKDALSHDGALAIECKRYTVRTPLVARDLISELEQARTKHPELQVWILASTRAMGADEKEELDQAANRKALAVLYLDPGTTEPFLSKTPCVNALCATDIETTLGLLERVPKGEKRKVKVRLEAIRGHAGFERWRNSLIEEIRNRLPIWRFVVSRRNLALAERIRRTPFDLGTEYDASKAVPRRVQADLEAWFQKAIEEPGDDNPPFAVVLGERYDGKTWLTYQWLLDVAERSPVPIFFISSARGSRSDRGLLDCFQEDLTPALHCINPHTVNAYVQHFRSSKSGNGPWALVILDGLNEYLEPATWRRYLAAALGLGEIGCRPAAVIATVRERSWPTLKEFLPKTASLEEVLSPATSSDGERKSEAGREDFANLPNRNSVKHPLSPTEISLGPFDPEELQAALSRLGLPSNFLASLPGSAQALAHRPRYLGLLAAHVEHLDQYAAVTPEVLHWLDLSDKIGRTREGLTDWGPESLQEVLRDLAKRWLAQRFLDLASVREVLGKLTTSVCQVLSDLQSEGALLGSGGQFRIEPERLAMGYGLFLRDGLIVADRKNLNLDEALSDLVAQLADVDETVDALRAAATLALFETEGSLLQGNNPEDSVRVLDTLLAKWMNARNLRSKDLEAIDQLRRLLLGPLLRLTNELWRRSARDCRGREVALMVFGELVETEGEGKERLRGALREWFHQLPARGSWVGRTKAQIELGREDDAAVENAVRSKLSLLVEQPEVRSFGLRLVEDLDVFRLQTLGLYLTGRAPDLVDPDDLLAFIAGRFVSEESVDSGDCWVIRRVLENIPSSWFLNTGRKVNEATDVLRKSLLELVRIANRADLAGLKKQLRSKASTRKRHPASPTRTNVLSRVGQPFETDEKARRFAESIGHLVIDPSLPEPPSDLRHAFAQRVRKDVLERRRTTRIDLDDLEDLLPALAAWAPGVGAGIVNQALRNLPAQIQESHRTLLMELRGHASLALGTARRALQDALTLSYQNGKAKQSVPQREMTLALLPGAGAEGTLSLASSEGMDHKETISLGGALIGAADRGTFVRALTRSKNPRRKRRIRFLLAAAGKSTEAMRTNLRNVPLPTREMRGMTSTLRSREKWDITAALDLATVCNAKLDPRLLVPIARNEIAKGTRASDYASRLLMESLDYGQCKEFLDDFWRSLVAARNGQHAQEFLNEISSDLRRYEGGVPTPGGMWDQQHLPHEVVKHLDAARVAEWARILAPSEDIVHPRYSGLILPTFEWCLDHSDIHAETLWPHVNPFQRQRFSVGILGLTMDGVDWPLHLLNRPGADDQMARGFLRRLILDARNDLEIHEIALGACFQDRCRLRELAQELAVDPIAERRARGVAILGWLVEGEKLLKRIKRSDPSTWVREQADIALDRHAVDSWARHWLDRFLTAGTAIDRWAAGRLFLESADRRVDSWAWKRVKSVKLRRRVRGEAFLLLRAAQDRTKREGAKLKDWLLGSKVSELATTVHPWRRDDEWVLDYYGRGD